MQGNLNVMRYTTGRAQTYEEDLASLQDCIRKYDKPNNNFWIWAIERKADQAFVGTVALLVNEEGEDEIGFRFMEKYWGNGYGQEAADALCTYAFEAKNIQTLVAYVFVDNVGSVKILERAGFKLIKEWFNEEYKAMDRLYHLAK
jgi:RimJ/RimL family protein N-acetyltransferase